MSHGGGGGGGGDVDHVFFNLHLGVGHSVLCQMEGVGHVFYNHHILKCSGPPPPVLFDQSLSNTNWTEWSNHGNNFKIGRARSVRPIGSYELYYSLNWPLTSEFS